MVSEFLTVAKQVFQKAQRPMRPKEIVSAAVKAGLFSDKRSGRTPHQTMKSKLSVDVRRKGIDSEFVRTGPGLFYLRALLNGQHIEYRARPIAKPKSSESVLVFDGGWFPRHERFQGIRPSWRRLYAHLLRPDVCEYMHRLDAEKSNVHKQALTYIIVTRRGAVLAYRRGNYNRVEDFLRGSYCIGFGGHVTQDDRTLFTPHGMGVWEAAVRELTEELDLPPQDRVRLKDGVGLEIVGVLNDDSSEVGQRHIAFVFQYEVSSDARWHKPQRGEKSVTQLRWLIPHAKTPAIWNFEYWSQLCLREYFPNLVEAAPAFRVHRKRPFQPPHLLCVLGAVGSGKSEATKTLCKEFGYKEINTGKLLAKLMGIAPVPQTPRNVFQRRAWTFISSEKGPELLAAEIVKVVTSIDSPRILVDGIRQKVTLDALKTRLTDRRIALLFVHTTPDVAYRLYQVREGTQVSFEGFLDLRDAPVEGEVSDMIGLADAILYNWTGRGKYRRVVRQLVRELWRRDRT